MGTRHYDAVVIGSGQAGGPLASALARSGRKTALIEREHHGGTCVNVGCTPTKTMVASARVAYLSRRSSDYGILAGETSVDMAAVRSRKRAMVRSFREGSTSKLEETEGLDLYDGEARLTGPKSVTVASANGTEIELVAEQIMINTGGRPSMPPIDGIDDVSVLDSTSVMELDEVPRHLVVIGGGYVGLEFAQMFRRFGSDVTIVNRGQQIASHEDEDVADALATILVEDGITIIKRTTVERLECAEPGIRLTLAGQDTEQALDGSHVLIATGRTPNTDALNPRAAGVHMDERGYIPTDDRLQTNVPGIYALGDVRGGPAFTHTSYDDFRVMRANLIDGEDATIAGRMVPYTVFTDPQLGRIGLSERDARQVGRNIRVASMPMSSVARALEVDERRGLMKAVVDEESKQILGAAVLGFEGGEVMAMLQIAMMGGLPYTSLRDGIFAHPTLAESFNTLFNSFVCEG